MNERDLDLSADLDPTTVPSPGLGSDLDSGVGSGLGVPVWPVKNWHGAREVDDLVRAQSADLEQGSMGEQGVGLNAHGLPLRAYPSTQDSASGAQPRGRSARRYVRGIGGDPTQTVVTTVPDAVAFARPVTSGSGLFSGFITRYLLWWAPFVALAYITGQFDAAITSWGWPLVVVDVVVYSSLVVGTVYWVLTRPWVVRFVRDRGLNLPTPGE